MAFLSSATFSLMIPTVLLSFALLFAPPAFAQVTAGPAAPNGHEIEEAKRVQQEREKKALALLEELITESASLTLIENQLFVQTKAVEMLWKHDETRARSLVRDVMSQIATINATLAEEFDQVRNVRYNRLGAFSSLRQQMVNMLASKDSKLALEFLLATRFQGAGGRNMGQSDQHLETMLAIQAAANDPQMLVQIAEENLRKGLNYQTIELWNNLRRKDPKLGVRFGNEIISKIRSTDLLSNYEPLNVTVSMLQHLKAQMDEASRAQKNASGISSSPQVNLAEAQQSYRELLELLVNNGLKLTSTNMMTPQSAEIGRNLLRHLKQALPEVEKQLPSSYTALRNKLTSFENAMYHSPQQKYYEEYQQKMQNKSYQELLSMASSAPQEVREQIYSQVINKALEQGDRETARKIATENFADLFQARQMLANHERQLAERAASQGKYDEARRSLAQFASDDERAVALTRWAMMAFGRKDEVNGRSFLDDAHGLISGQMQTRMQLEAQMNIANGYLSFEPDRSFEIAEAAIERLNKVITAKKEVSVFNGMKDGEMYMMSGDISEAHAGNLGNLLSSLGRKDLDRTYSILKGWRHNEVRLLMTLMMLQSILSNNASPAYTGRATLMRLN